MYYIDMIKMLMNVLGGSLDDIPLDPVLRVRLNFGGVLGLLLFSGAETLEQRMEAMAKALPVLGQLQTASRSRALQKPLFELRKIVPCSPDIPGILRLNFRFSSGTPGTISRQSRSSSPSLVVASRLKSWTKASKPS